MGRLFWTFQQELIVDEVPNPTAEQGTIPINVAALCQLPHGRLRDVGTEGLEEAVAEHRVGAPAAHAPADQRFAGRGPVPRGRRCHVEVFPNLGKRLLELPDQPVGLVQRQGHSVVAGVVNESRSAHAARNPEVADLRKLPGVLRLLFQLLVRASEPLDGNVVLDAQHLRREPEMHVLACVDDLGQSRVSEKREARKGEAHQLLRTEIHGGEHLAWPGNEAVSITRRARRVLLVGVLPRCAASLHQHVRRRGQGAVDALREDGQVRVPQLDVAQVLGVPDQHRMPRVS